MIYNVYRQVSAQTTINRLSKEYVFMMIIYLCMTLEGYMVCKSKAYKRLVYTNVSFKAYMAHGKGSLHTDSHQGLYKCLQSRTVSAAPGAKLYIKLNHHYTYCKWRTAHQSLISHQQTISFITWWKLWISIYSQLAWTKCLLHQWRWAFLSSKRRKRISSCEIQQKPL